MILLEKISGNVQFKGIKIIIFFVLPGGFLVHPSSKCHALWTLSLRDRFIPPLPVLQIRRKKSGKIAGQTLPV